VLKTAQVVHDGRVYHAIVRDGQLEIYRDGVYLCGGPWKGCVIHGRGKAPESVWEELDRLLNEQQDE